jgi:hypothetical protein
VFFVNNSGSLVPYILTKIVTELLKLGIRLTLALKYVIGLQGTTNSCLTEPIKITLNPSGDNGAISLLMMIEL